MQSCPELMKAASRTLAATCSGSASSSTTTGALPPSSRCRRFSDAAAAREHLHARRDVPGQRHHADARVAGDRGADRIAVAGDHVEHAGRDEVRDQLGEGEQVSGVCSDGLITTVLPVASAGPSFQLAMPSG